MGFSGGGSNVLKPHTHDGTVAQDGGALNMDNVTQASLTAGDIVYSDGVHLQRLAYPGAPAGEALTAVAASSAPSWAAAGGAALELIDYTAATSNTTTIDTTFTNIPNDDMTELYCVASGCNGGFSISVQIYDQTQSLLTDANYTNHGHTIISGTQTLINSSGDTSWSIVPSTLEPYLAIMHISLGKCGSGAADYFPRIITSVCGTNGISQTGGVFNKTPRPSGIAGIKFGISANNAIENGSYLGIYKRTT